MGPAPSPFLFLMMVGGVVVLLTHCEGRFSGNPPMLGAYRRFLEFVAESDAFTWSSPAAVLERGLVP